jgi:membrane-bound metal-dependent hydrolase YbcI (DUF457 family)
MDIVTHLAFGSALNALDRNRWIGPGAGAALVLGSIVPDVDATIALTRGMDVYLATHETGTHTLLAALAEAALLAGGLTFLVRGARYRSLTIAALVAILGHFWWDLLSGSTMQLLWPFSGARLSWPIVAMADPWVVIALAAGVAIGWWRPPVRYRAAVASLALVTAIAGAHVIARERALATFARFAAATGPVDASWRAEPVWASFDRWRIHARLGSRLGTWAVTAFTNTMPTLVFNPQPAGDADAVAASRSVPIVQRFLGFADFPFAEVEEDGNQHRVLWSDLKFCGPLRCDLRFGVAFENRRAVYEVVWVGKLRFVRPVD